jgi:DNA-binding NarL/FixJ family response regulator
MTDSSDIPLRVVIADDHGLLRQGLKQAIESGGGVKVVGEAGDGRAAVTQVETLQPDIVILDVDMPELDGFDAARAIRKSVPDSQIIFLTVHREPDALTEAFELGARGYVLKDSAVSDILSAIQAVAAGQYYTSPAMTSYLVSGKRSGPLPSEPGIEILSPTEIRILKLLSEYKTSKQIAAELFISPRTVQTHRANICQKLQLEGNHALMKYALDHKRDLT